MQLRKVQASILFLIACQLEQFKIGVRVVKKRGFLSKRVFIKWRGPLASKFNAAGFCIVRVANKIC